MRELRTPGSDRGAARRLPSLPDPSSARPVEAVYWAPDETALPGAIVAEGDLRGLDVRLRALRTADAVRQAVSDRDAALGLILPAARDSASTATTPIVVLHTSRIADADVALVGFWSQQLSICCNNRLRRRLTRRRFLHRPAVYPVSMISSA